MAINPNAGNEAEAARRSAEVADEALLRDAASIQAEAAAELARTDDILAKADRDLAAAQAAQAQASGNNPNLVESAQSKPQSPGTSGAQTNSSTEQAGIVDKRIRIRCRPSKEPEIYGPAGDENNPMSILYETGGIVFPYTPTISYQQNPLWQSQELTHFIQQYYYFTAIESAQITINGKFTIQNAREGRYLLGVFHFLRSYSKMHFGLQEPEATRGLPPPVLLLDGYGSLMFNSLPIIIRTWNIDFPDNVDYIKVFTKNSESSNTGASTGGSGGLGDAYLPAITNVNIVAMVQRPPNTLKKDFNLAEFRNGNLLRGGGFT